jgi:hypothetical protein
MWRILVVAAVVSIGCSNATSGDAGAGGGAAAGGGGAATDGGSQDAGSIITFLAGSNHGACGRNDGPRDLARVGDVVALEYLPSGWLAFIDDRTALRFVSLADGSIWTRKRRLPDGGATDQLEVQADGGIFILRDVLSLTPPMLAVATDTSIVTVSSLQTDEGWSRLAGSPDERGQIDGDAGLARFSLITALGSSSSSATTLDAFAMADLSQGANWEAGWLRDYTPASAQVWTVAGSGARNDSSDGPLRDAGLGLVVRLNHGPRNPGVFIEDDTYGKGGGWLRVADGLWPGNVVTLGPVLNAWNQQDGVLADGGGTLGWPAGVADWGGSSGSLIFLEQSGTLRELSLTPTPTVSTFHNSGFPVFPMGPLASNGVDTVYFNTACGIGSWSLSAGYVPITAGADRAPTSIDGVGAEAAFVRPSALAWSSLSGLYVVDESLTLRMVSLEGAVWTPPSANAYARGVAVLPDDRVLVSRWSIVGSTVATTWSISDNLLNGFVELPPIPNASPYSMAVQPDGGLFYAGPTQVGQFFLDGGVGQTWGDPLAAGYVDGLPSVARFGSAHFITADPITGLIYVADGSNNVVRVIDPNTKLVSTLAGSGATGSSDGPATLATFDAPGAIAAGNGSVYVWDQRSRLVRRIDATTGATTTITGRESASFVPGGPRVLNQLAMTWVPGHGLAFADYDEGVVGLISP